MVNKDSHFADFVRFCPPTYTCTQQSLPPLWAAIKKFALVVKMIVSYYIICRNHFDNPDIKNEQFFYCYQYFP